MRLGLAMGSHYHAEESSLERTGTSSSLLGILEPSEACERFPSSSSSSLVATNNVTEVRERKREVKERDTEFVEIGNALR